MKSTTRVFLWFLLLGVACQSGLAQSGTISTFAGYIPTSTIGGPATSQFIGYPRVVISDRSGGFFFLGGDAFDDRGHRVYRVTSNGLLQLVAGTSRGFSGDGGPATAAQLFYPGGLALDAAGNLYIADSENNRVRKVTSDGVIHAVAGTGSFGNLGDGGPATAAQLDRPTGVAVDSFGNLFISDSLNHRVRKVTPDGVIHAFAGVANQYGAFGGDGGPATAARFTYPTALAVDVQGNLFITDGGNMRIRKVTLDGLIQTVAGNASLGPGNSFECRYGGDGGLATSALICPASIALDTGGNLYIADSSNERVRKVSPNGVISTVAGDGLYGFAGDGGPATSARFYGPNSVAIDSVGNLLIGDYYNFRIRKVTPGGTISTVAGAVATSCVSGDGGLATLSRLCSPGGIATDAFGAVYFIDLGSYRIRKVATNGTISTIAGTGLSGYSGDGGPATAAQLSRPSEIAVDSAGNVYVSDNNRVRKISTDGVIRTIAGTGGCGKGSLGDGGPATSAQFSGSSGLALDAAGNLFIADSGNNRVRKVTPSGVISTVAGSGPDFCNDYLSDYNLGGFSGDGGPATTAKLDGPTGIAVDSSGNLFIVDANNYRIRKVTPTGTISTIAGTGLGGFDGDGGPAISARLGTPRSIALDAAGNLYIADPAPGVRRIRKVTPAGLIWTVAGNGTEGSTGDGGPATAAGFGYPGWVAVDAAGNLLISDSAYSVIRIVANSSRHDLNTNHDFNGDGTADILWRDASGNVSIWLLQGYAISKDSFVANIWPSWSIAGSGDFNGDRKSDILWHDAGGDVAIWMMDGASVAGYRTIANIWPDWSIAGIGDFNGDRKSDILWRNSAGDVSIWLIDGFSIVSYRRIANVSPGWSIAGTADFNGDGKADILWRDEGGNVAIWLIDGYSLLNATTIGNMPAASRIAGTGDFNGDGYADILWREDSGNVSIWFMSGNSIVSRNTIASIPANWAVSGVGDFNGDGKSDILWKEISGTASIWLMDGTSYDYRHMGNVSGNNAQ